MGMDRSDKFREWLKEMTPEKVEKLVMMEKQVRLLIHVWDLINEIDVRVFHNLARVSHKIRKEYEDL
jgi:hypothetical protein